MTAIVTLRRLSREMQLSDGLAAASTEVCGVNTKIVMQHNWCRTL